MRGPDAVQCCGLRAGEFQVGKNAAALRHTGMFGGAAAVLVQAWGISSFGRPSPEFASRDWRVQQRNRRAMPNDFWLLWIIAPTQGEHVVIYFNDDGFPPAVGNICFLGNHQMANLNVVPTGRQARRRRRSIGRSIAARRYDHLFVQIASHVRYEAAAVAVQPSRRQLGRRWA
jgi:hypothetical protein